MTAGTPSGVTWHVKNGWLPDGDDNEWHINSIGAFSGNGRNYMIAVLTDDNPSEQYGIDTIENVARPVNRDINAVRPHGVQPHVTVQNKVAAAEAKRVYAELLAGFAPFEAEATGLHLWRYLGGPWESCAHSVFDGEGRPEARGGR